MSPGSYLRDLRGAAGLTLEELALRLDSVPHVSARRRAEWLDDFEAGRTPLGISTAIALAEVDELHLDLDTMRLLIDRTDEEPLVFVTWHAAKAA